MIMNNFGMALRLSIPLFGAMVISLILFGQDAVSGQFDFNIGAESYGPTPVVAPLVSSLFQAVTALWVAVAWHRFILLEEKPSGYLPTFNGSRILSYFGHGLLVALVVIGVFAVIGIIGGVLVSMGGPISVIGVGFFIAGGVIVVYISARIYVILPAAAIGESLTISQGWEATKGYTGTIVFAYFLYILAAVVIGFVVGLVSMFLGILGTLVLISLNVFLIMIGMSFLTTVYGVTVEQRELP